MSRKIALIRTLSDLDGHLPIGSTIALRHRPIAQSAQVAAQGEAAVSADGLGHEDDRAIFPRCHANKL